ncbi:MAG: tyrosine--tRNA ligase, partial [Oscillospiraceae bacterium]|nr:tyrosine--tRNA ligase [Oscillospiraceae bacterium]
RRGLIAQMTNEEAIKDALENKKVTFYIGFDATANSLHVGHLLQLLIIKRMQMAGHMPIVLLGTGTTMVGDPSGKTDMRKMLTVEQINYNAECFRKQMERIVDFAPDKCIVARNGDWLMNLNYIELLRDVGVHFSVNRMLAAECYKARMEKGLTFLEFNYMIMQSYDFLHLFRTYGNTLELGGDDQWSNIIGGVELVRRSEGKDVYGMTFNLLTNSEGKKMGKTEKGAVWLDKDKMSPYDFFQYWRNIGDNDVIKCLKFLTFLPIEEIEEMEKWEGEQLNKAKEILAFDLTKTVHGEEEAQKALDAARAIFVSGADTEHMPSTDVTLTDGAIGIIELLKATGLAPSNAEARRLIQQGGLTVDGEKVTDINYSVKADAFEKGHVVLKKGKKVYHKVKLG